MEISEINHYYTKFKYGEDIFHQLMPKKIREILLISTFYDAFIFEQDGQLSELIFGEYHQLNLTEAPHITSVPVANEAVKILSERKFDLVITMMRIGDMTPFKLAKFVKENYENLPVLLLINNRADFAILDSLKEELKYIDNTFLWNGDTKLFLAMIKNIEDRQNLDIDTEIGLVRVILLVEDSINYYSIYLPMLYDVIMRQTHQLIIEELNEIDKRLRMRVRPKIVLAKDYEEAISIYNKYQDYLLCVISDIRFNKKGKLNGKAGFDLVEHIRRIQPDMPVILQSSETKNRERAEKINCYFVDKKDEHLLQRLRSFFVGNLGFGNFIFRDSKNNFILEAKSLIDFENKIKYIPDDSLLYHSRSNHFSNWLLARGEIEIARRIKPVKVEDFDSTEELRKYISNIFSNIRIQRNKGKIIGFDKNSLADINQIVRLSDGSLGGKGRGLAFLNALICIMDLQDEFNGINISLPSTAIIGTAEFDSFLERNNITERVKNKTDQEIDQIFLEGHLSDGLYNRMKIYLQNIFYPLAVRSSSLLEDSQLQPFAGIYRTFMIPNNHSEPEVNLQNLVDAIKLVFASVYLKGTKDYIENLSYKTEEEKMAVIIQEVVGSNHGDGYYYPHVSGVAQSYNFYPTSYMEHADGIATIALGLGKAVVEGKYNYRFSPKYPENLLLSQEEMIKNSQKNFYAINLEYKDFDLNQGEDITLSLLDLNTAEKHKVLDSLVSVLDYENQILHDGLVTKGYKVLTFAGILKHNHFPLASVLKRVLDISEISLGIPVEIEFAISLLKDPKPTFYILQVRPLSVNPESYNIDIENLNKDDMFLFTNQAMGNGAVTDICDIIYVKPEIFDKTQTEKIAKEVETLNNYLKEKKKHYILLGPGRWGTRDRFLGIPVNWNSINMAKVIVEFGLENFMIDTSQGTHFFHNLVAMNVGYFNVKYKSESDFIDWEWLYRQPTIKDLKYTSLVRLENPLSVKMDGKKGLAVVGKNN